MMLAALFFTFVGSPFKSVQTPCGSPVIEAAALNSHCVLGVILNPNNIISVVISISSLTSLLIPLVQTEWMEG